MIVCPYCGPKIVRTFPAGFTYSKSRVVESRQIVSRQVYRGKEVRTRSVVRVRECLKCRFRWKTVEKVYTNGSPDTRRVAQSRLRGNAQGSNP